MSIQSLGGNDLQNRESELKKKHVSKNLCQLKIDKKIMLAGYENILDCLIIFLSWKWCTNLNY